MKFEEVTLDSFEALPVREAPRGQERGFVARVVKCPRGGCRQYAKNYEVINGPWPRCPNHGDTLKWYGCVYIDVDGNAYRSAATPRISG